MSTTAVPSAAAQKQLKQGKVKKGIFSVIRHLVLALLAFIWLVPIAWLLLTSFSPIRASTLPALCRKALPCGTTSAL